MNVAAAAVLWHCQVVRCGAAAATSATVPPLLLVVAAPQHSMPVRENKYRELALQAVEVTESDNAHRAAGRLRNKDNMAIYFFLRCASHSMCSTCSC